MNTILITGDRSMSPAYLPLVAIEMLRAVNAGDTILTGDSGRGVDTIVQEMGERAGVEVTVTDSTEANEVVFVHADPHTSSRITPFLAAGDDSVRIVTMADLAV